MPARVVDEAVRALRRPRRSGEQRRRQPTGRAHDVRRADWDHLFAVNTRATWLLAKAAHPALKAARGAIVAIGSMSGSNPHANLGAYGPSKAAVIMLVQVLAQEMAPDGIRVNAVSPGWSAPA